MPKTIPTIMTREVLQKDELENQLILRLPPEASADLRELLRSDTKIKKNRITIEMEEATRHGAVKFDNWVLPAKIVDLPCVLETHKTIDRKTFYKTADISQMLICTKDQTIDEEELAKTKNKTKLMSAEKKNQWPHGITPPLKNVRKWRFRKTLKKKNSEEKEVEKEIMRLLREDNEAVSVTWEIRTDKVKSEISPGESGSASELSDPILSTSQAEQLERDMFGDLITSSEDEYLDVVDSEDDKISPVSNGDMSKKMDDLRERFASICNRKQRYKQDIAEVDGKTRKRSFQTALDY